jgi:hypothetical protein
LSKCICPLEFCNFLKLGKLKFPILNPKLKFEKLEMEANREKYAADILSIKEAHDRIKPYIHRTPVLTSESLNSISGRSLFFKCECLQKG